jgi:putative phage-type endonuclease
MAAIARLSPYDSPKDIWLQKTGQAKPKEVTRAMKVGLALEPVVKNEYAEATGHVLEQATTIFHKDHNFIGGTPDFLCLDDPNLLLECKTASVHALAMRDENGVPLWGDEGTEMVPVQYYVQCQTYMGLTGRRRADLAVMFKNDDSDIRIYRMAFNPEVFNMLLAKAVQFWDRYVIPRVEPPTDFMTPQVSEYLCRKAMGGGIELNANNDPALLRMAFGLEQYGNIRKDMEAHEAEAKAAILEQMAVLGATKVKGTLPDGPSFTLAIQGGGEGKDVTDWSSVAYQLALRQGLNAVPTDIIMAHTIKGKPKAPYLRAYFGARKKVTPESYTLQPKLA